MKQCYKHYLNGVAKNLNSTTDRESDTSQEQKRENTKSAKLALFIALVALSFTAIGITAGYKHWLRIHIKTKEALAEITTLKEQLALTANKKMLDDFTETFKNTTNQERERLEQSVTKLEQVSKQANYAASTVNQQIAAFTAKQEQQANNTATTQPATQYAYVPFILQSAERQLHFLHDKKGTLALLKIADQMLLEIGAKEHLALRQYIAEDIAAIEQYQPIDLEALSTIISQLEEEITPLMGIDTNKSDHTSSTAVQPIEQQDSLLASVKRYFKQSIKLQKTDEPPRQLLVESDKKRIDQLIQLRLESLRLMLLQRQDKAYHWQINRLINTLNRYYSPQQATPWVNKLEQLASIRLDTQPPTLTSTQTPSFSTEKE